MSGFLSYLKPQAVFLDCLGGFEVSGYPTCASNCRGFACRGLGALRFSALGFGAGPRVLRALGLVGLWLREDRLSGWKRVSSPWRSQGAGFIDLSSRSRHP